MFSNRAKVLIASLIAIVFSVFRYAISNTELACYFIACFCFIALSLNLVAIACKALSLFEEHIEKSTFASSADRKRMMIKVKKISIWLPIVGIAIQVLVFVLLRNFFDVSKVFLYNDIITIVALCLTFIDSEIADMLASSYKKKVI